MGIGAIDHLNVVADDVEATLDFYRRLGVEVGREEGVEGGAGRAVLLLNDHQKINVQPRRPGSAAQQAGLHFGLVWDGTVQELADIAEKRGVKVLWGVAWNNKGRPLTGLGYRPFPPMFGIQNRSSCVLRWGPHRRDRVRCEGQAPRPGTSTYSGESGAGSVSPLRLHHELPEGRIANPAYLSDT